MWVCVVVEGWLGITPPSKNDQERKLITSAKSRFTFSMTPAKWAASPGEGGDDESHKLEAKQVTEAIEGMLEAQINWNTVPGP